MGPATRPRTAACACRRASRSASSPTCSTACRSTWRSLRAIVPLDRARIRAVLFDVDGTLRNTDDELVARLAALLRPLERVLPQADARRAARRVVMGLETPTQRGLQALDWAGVDRPAYALVTRLGTMRGRQPTQAIAGVVEMLHELHSQIPIAIVSAGPKSAVERFLGEHGLDQLFATVATGLTCRRTKPHPDPINWVARSSASTLRSACLWATPASTSPLRPVPARKASACSAASASELSSSVRAPMRSSPRRRRCPACSEPVATLRYDLHPAGAFPDRSATRPLSSVGRAPPW